MTIRQASIADVKAKLSRDWLGNDVVQVTARGTVIATLYPVGSEPTKAQVVPRTTVPTTSTEAKPWYGDRQGKGLSKASQAGGKSRLEKE